MMNTEENKKKHRTIQRTENQDSWESIATASVALEKVTFILMDVLRMV